MPCEGTHHAIRWICPIGSEAIALTESPSHNVSSECPSVQLRRPSRLPAASQDPYHPLVLLGLARAYHRLENHERLRQTYSLLKSADPELASRFAHLESGGAATGRAAETGADVGYLLWEEEDD